MIFQWINGDLSTLNLIYILISLIIGLTIHEFSHGFVAYKLGDDTAKSQGRLSVNPLHHIDPFGFIAIMLVGFGWAKPVMMNPYKFKHLRDGIMLTALAGPLSNFLLAILGSLLLNFNIPEPINTFVQYFIMLNLILATFNILPIPPLDGFKVLCRVLPDSLFYKVEEFERKYGFILLLVLLITGVLSALWYPIYNLFSILLQYVANIF